VPCFGVETTSQANARVALQHEFWQEMVAAKSPKSFQDTDFVAGPRSVDGRQEEKSSTGDFFKATMSEVTRRLPEVSEEVLCHCGLVAQLRRVQKRGPTYGRPYHACPSRHCRFFEFADQGSTVAALELQWKRFPATGAWTVVSDEGFMPSDVRQGGVGDCRWMMHSDYSDVFAFHSSYKYAILTPKNWGVGLMNVYDAFFADCWLKNPLPVDTMYLEAART